MKNGFLAKVLVAVASLLIGLATYTFTSTIADIRHDYERDVGHLSEKIKEIHQDLRSLRRTTRDIGREQRRRTKPVYSIDEFERRLEQLENNNGR